METAQLRVQPRALARQPGPVCSVAPAGGGGLLSNKHLQRVEGPT